MLENYHIDVDETPLNQNEWETVNKIFKSSNIADLRLKGNELRGIKSFVCFAESKQLVYIFFQPSVAADNVWRMRLQVPSANNPRKVESDTLDFCESLGFLMKFIDLAKLPPAKKQDLLSEFRFLDQSAIDNAIIQPTVQRYIGQISHQEAVKLILAGF